MPFNSKTGCPTGLYGNQCRILMRCVFNAFAPHFSMELLFHVRLQRAIVNGSSDPALAVMPPKQKPFAELGGVDRVDTCFRADLRYRTPTGQQVHIHGPRREHRHRAQKDLEDMRAAGAVGSTREKGLEIMAAEARRIQLSAHFEAEARETWGEDSGNAEAMNALGLKKLVKKLMPECKELIKEHHTAGPDAHLHRRLAYALCGLGRAPCRLQGGAHKKQPLPDSEEAGEVEECILCDERF